MKTMVKHQKPKQNGEKYKDGDNVKLLAKI